MRTTRTCLLGVALAVALSSPLFAQLSDITQPGDPIIPSSNNAPGSEGADKALDNQPTKYLNFDKLNTGFTVSPSVGLSIVSGLTLTSANDAPERDPASYTLEGSYDGSNFVSIASGAVAAFPSRFFKQTILFTNTVPFLRYRLLFPTVANAATANSMQISEVELLGVLAPTDVTVPGDPVVASSNNNPGSEGADKAIDNQPTKYLNFDKVNTGFTVTPSAGGTRLSGLTLTSANDAPERDPSSYLLEGSLDGTAFFTIASNAVPTFPARFYKQFLFFPNSRAYKAYRLTFPTIANVGTANSMQISEVELLGVTADLPQDVTQPGDPIVGTSNNAPGSEGPDKAIDNQPTKYLNFDKLNTGFTVSPSVGLSIVSGLTLTSANDAPERDPASYTLEGSYDGSNFVSIASGAVPAFTARFQKVTILVENKIPYLKYRLIFPTVANAATANSMQISEVELLGVLAPTDVTVPGDQIVGTSNNAPGSEGPDKAIDNQPTKYLNFDKLNTGFTVTPNVGETILNGITLTSANDAPERDPASYTLDGSSDGTNFVSIASGPVPAFPSRFFKQYIFFPDNTKSYKSYRLIFPTVANAATANSMQISEVELLGVTPGAVNTNAVDTLIRRQPQDTPVLLGSAATFRVGLTGPWKVQWYKNGAAIPGANTANYTTAAATLADDGALIKAVVQSSQGTQTSDEVILSIFTPSTIESIGVSWPGAGANGAPTAVLPADITGFQPQAYWNSVATGGSGSTNSVVNSSNQVHPTIQVQWATSGEWGSGTGNGDATERMLNGLISGKGTSISEATAATVTLTGVPAGNHTLLLYTVQVPLEFWNEDFIVTTFDAGGAEKAAQRRYIRPQNSDEYNPSPGFILVSSESAASRSVGNMMRFDNLQPENGQIQIRFYAPGRTGGQGPGLNGMQLLLNPPPAVASPLITVQPVSANGILGGQATLTVEATGPNLAYQWLKAGKEIAGATGPRLTLSNLSTNDAGVYWVAISNPSGRILSRKVLVGVLQTIQLTEGLINYFKFDDSDTIVTNSAPGGQNGAARGVSPFHDAGLVGQALVLKQADQVYAFVTNYTKPSQAMTISGWISSADGQWGPLINSWMAGQATGASGQFQLDVSLVNSVPTLNGRMEVGPNIVLASGAVDGSYDEFGGVWHQFAMSANGLTLSIYWDGALVGTIDYLGSINAGPFSWLSMAANLTNDPVNLPASALVVPTFNGWIDDVAMWNRSLSADEIVAVYAAGITGTPLDGVPPVLTPPVDIVQTPAGIVISWPPELTSFILESTPSLEGTPVWTPVPGVVNNSITISNPAGNAFFRLKKQ